MRLKILGVCHQGLQSSNWELLNLVLPQNLCEENIIWLISNFVLYVWKNFLGGEAVVRVDKFFGFLTFKFKKRRDGVGNFIGII